MIKATRGRILVKLLPATTEHLNTLNLTLIDKKKHFDHTSRKGVVQSIGRGVYLVRVGEIVVFSGSAGFTLDGDPEVERPEYGEGYRWLKEKDLLAVEETAYLEEAVR